MKKRLEDIAGIEKGNSVAICLHGPSLSKNVETVERLQSQGAIKRISTNNWFDFFSSGPDYWVLANTIDTVKRHCEKMNQDPSSMVMFADSVDLSDFHFIDSNLKCDYLPYDQRHFRGETCNRILRRFRDHYEMARDLKFHHYGNNPVMWKRIKGGAGFSMSSSDCCARIVDGRSTIQEFLQEISGHQEHYSTGDTVALHALALSVIMGFEKIYISGLDLDYSAGYSKSIGEKQIHAPADFWRKNKEISSNLINDLRIINESAKMLEIQIINLKKNSWYGIFEEGIIEEVE